MKWLYQILLKTGGKEVCPDNKASFTPEKMGKETYYRRKMEGICVLCGKEKAQKDKVCCHFCNEKTKESRRKHREFSNNHGLCPDCGKNKLFGQERRCPECLSRVYATNIKCRSKNKSYASEYYKKDILRLKFNGVCRGCRKKSVMPGHTYCENCLIKKRNKKNSDVNIPRSERYYYGMCYICGGLLDGEKKLCNKCSKRLANNFPKERPKNIYWLNDNKIAFNK